MHTAYTILLAPNPSLMTGPGTNTIVLGSGDAGAIVIDPAADDPTHLEAIIQAGSVRGGLRSILITHGHPDHIGGAVALRERLSIPIYAFNRQGVPFADHELPDNAILSAGDDTLRALYTPGHRFDHLSFLLDRQRILFAGDLISGISTNVIAPPEGDMLAYLHSLERLQDLEIAQIVPGHGPIVEHAQAKIAEYIAHRHLREQQVLATLASLPAGSEIPTLVKHIYLDVDPKLHAIAAWSVEAHLLKLEQEGRVKRSGNGWTLS